MQQKNIVVCILLTFVTCGLYGIYWMITLNDEINLVSGRNGTTGGMVFLFSLVTCGIYGFVWMYQMGTTVDELRNRRNLPGNSSALLYLILSIFGLGIVSYALMQNELNQCLDN